MFIWFFKNNIKDINHSCIKLDESYENYENNCIKITEEIIEKELLKGMPISDFIRKGWNSLKKCK